MKKKVLNLYCGLGGNRKFWKGVKVIAVENDYEVAQFYKDCFPGDEVIITDAHEYLLKYHNYYDFIWSSRPCPTHSRARYLRRKNSNPVYPDLRLYEEILFLQYHHKKRWVVENVIPYYTPLISPTMIIGRHAFWSNFRISILKNYRANGLDVNSFSNGSILQKLYDICLDGYSFKQSKLTLLRNMVDPDIGLHVFKESKKYGLFEVKDLVL